MDVHAPQVAGRLGGSGQEPVSPLVVVSQLVEGTPRAVGPDVLQVEQPLVVTQVPHDRVARVQRAHADLAIERKALLAHPLMRGAL